MQIATTHKGTDFDGLASLIAATLIYPDSIPVLPKNINPKEIFENSGKSRKWMRR